MLWGVVCHKTTSTSLVRLPRDTANTILQTRHKGKARLSIEPVRRALCIILFLGASFSIRLGLLGGLLTWEVPMWKMTVVRMTALFVTASPIAYAQSASIAKR